MHVEIDDSLRNSFPDLKVSTIEIKNLENKIIDENLEFEKRILEERIRKEYVKFQEFEVIKKYNKFFKKFEKIYPISYQIKSILEGKSFPAQHTVVEAMFMAELKNMFLTVGHDLNLINGSLRTKLTNGSESYINIIGKEIKLKAFDIVTEDSSGIISSVLYGPDRRTMVTNKTRNYLFFSYFPYGENDEKIKNHFEDIVKYIRIFSNDFDRSNIEIFSI